jgi:transcriptional regulator with XRE-family HTH domain
MKDARMIGFRIAEYINQKNVSHAELCQLLNCSETQLRLVLRGRILLSFSQLSLLAKRFDIDVSELLQGKEEEYERGVVRCEGTFSNSSNREVILDIIDEYLDIQDSIRV